MAKNLPRSLSVLPQLLLPVHVVISQYKSSLRLSSFSPLLRHVTGHVVWFQLDPLSRVEVQLMQVGTVNVTSCSSKHVETSVDDGHGLEDDREKPDRKDA